MKTAGIREARQQFSKLLDTVKRGREIVITEHGRPVARLVPLVQTPPRGFPDMAAFRATMPRLQPPLSESIALERDEWRARQDSNLRPSA